MEQLNKIEQEIARQKAVKLQATVAHAASIVVNYTVEIENLKSAIEQKSKRVAEIMAMDDAALEKEFGTSSCGSHAEWATVKFSGVSGVNLIHGASFGR